TVLVFQLDGSGAIDTDVNKLVELVQNAKVPTAAWIGPSGGGARGATALLAQAAGYAAIAHGAHFGPVEPIYYDEPDRTVPAAAPLLDKEITIEQSTLQDFVASLDGKTINGVKVTTLKGDPGNRTLSTNVHF